ncbi:hypothetical protein GCM10025734_14640 [Kitasatospora paranensis]
MPRIGPGRPRARPDRVRADRAYASRKNHDYLRRRGIRCTVPDKADQARNRRKPGSRGDRPPKERVPRYLVVCDLERAREDLLAFAVFPQTVWKSICSNNPQERLNKEIGRRTDVVGIYPDRGSVIRLVGAVLAERSNEGAEQRRYIGSEVLGRCRLHPIEGEPHETGPTALTA